MAAKRLTSLSKGEFQSFFNSFDVVLSDCDGVLWEETNVIEGSPEAVNHLKENGKKFFYVTNNNGKTRADLVNKCKGLNYSATIDEMVCTSFLAAMYLKEQGFDKKVYLIGNSGMAKELEAVGIRHCGYGPDPLQGTALEIITKFKPDPEVGAVAVGFDEHFSYSKLVQAATYLQNPNVQFLGMNPDIYRPSPNKNTFPGTGCFISIVEIAAGRKAKILGKPESCISDYLIKNYNLDPKRTLMIGDNCNTDILLGKRCGFQTLLVLSGVTNQENVTELTQSNAESNGLIVPDYYTNQLADITQFLSN
ncbi:glycerol-3-phosphate phosphatase-like [Leptopilina boulardi]|uniref:glycerol-3-phosphate phosphatase-like n=1 Tax=Leptopilina boulardi TaxID=63433 RepID=UPI0021F638E0|nr:glycerol-3-phosphate phosphatase-like [Leptopilina boulardi]